MAMKPNNRLVFEFVKQCTLEGKNITAADIAEATNVPKKSVEAIVTAAFQRFDYMKRTAATIQLEDGTEKAVKFISCTDAGLDLDPDTFESKTDKKKREAAEAKAAKEAE